MGTVQQRSERRSLKRQLRLGLHPHNRASIASHFQITGAFDASSADRALSANRSLPVNDGFETKLLILERGANVQTHLQARDRDPKFDRITAARLGT